MTHLEADGPGNARWTRRTRVALERQGRTYRDEFSTNGSVALFEIHLLAVFSELSLVSFVARVTLERHKTVCVHFLPTLSNKAIFTLNPGIPGAPGGPGGQMAGH